MKRGPGTGIATAAAAICLAGLWGCGMFSPRDPVSGGGPGAVCLTPTNALSVIQNVQANYGLEAGKTCYEQMLDPVFVFHPDAADSIDAIPANPNPYANWNRDVEVDSNSALALNATFRSVVFDHEYATASISPDGRTQVRFYAYHLIVKASLVPPPDTLFQGLADITLVRGATEQWSITTWVDHRDGSGLKSWGYVRRYIRIRQTP